MIAMNACDPRAFLLSLYLSTPISPPPQTAASFSRLEGLCLCLCRVLLSHASRHSYSAAECVFGRAALKAIGRG